MDAYMRAVGYTERETELRYERHIQSVEDAERRLAGMNEQELAEVLRAQAATMRTIALRDHADALDEDMLRSTPPAPPATASDLAARKAEREQFEPEYATEGMLAQFYRPNGSTGSHRDAHPRSIPCTPTVFRKSA